MVIWQLTHFEFILVPLRYIMVPNGAYYYLKDFSISKIHWYQMHTYLMVHVFFPHFVPFKGSVKMALLYSILKSIIMASLSSSKLSNSSKKFSFIQIGKTRAQYLIAQTRRISIIKCLVTEKIQACKLLITSSDFSLWFCCL